MSEDFNTAPPAQFSIKNVLRRTFAVIGSNLASFAFVAVVLILLGHVRVLLVDRNPDEVSWWNIAISLLGKYVLGGCAGATLIYGTLLSLSGTKPSLRDLVRGLSFALPVITVFVMIDLPFVASTFLEIGNPGQSQTWFVRVLTAIAGCFLFVVWLGAAPAAIAEGLGVLAALGRSALLTGGRRLHIFVLVLAAGLAFEVPSTWAWKIAGTVSPGSASTSLLLLLWTTQQILPVVALFFWTVTGTVIYCTLRLAKEGTSVEQVASH